MAELKDLIDRDVLIRLQDSLSKLLGINVAFANLDCKTISSNADDKDDTRTTQAGSVCELLKQSEEGKAICDESDSEGARAAVNLNATVLLYRCHSYYSNFVMPIRIGEAVIGYLYGGQFFCAELKSREINQAWERLRTVTKAHILTDGNYRHIHYYFFHMTDGRPKEEDFDSICTTCVVQPHKEEELLTVFYQQTTPDDDGCRLKSVTDVSHAIMALFEVAHTLSRECTEKYLLKTQFDISKEVLAIGYRERILGLRIDKTYNKMCDKIGDILTKMQSSTLGHLLSSDVNEFEGHAVEILQKLVKREKLRILQTTVVNRFVLLLPVMKKVTFLKQTTESQSVTRSVRSNKEFNSLGGPLLKKEYLTTWLKELQSYRAYLVEQRSIGGLLVWLALGLTLWQLLN